MRKRILEKKQNTGASRRSILKAAAVAAIGMILDPQSEAQPALAPVDYGQGPTQTHLDPTNVFPLVAGWVLLTTNIPGSVNEATLQSVANLSPASAHAVYEKYAVQVNQDAFKVVRRAFGELAKAFSVPGSLYGGGQCPETPARVAPIAGLRGTGPAPAKTKKSGK